jgi:N-acetylated-alpha-linked acidic dipeptidase
MKRLTKLSLGLWLTAGFGLTILAGSAEVSIRGFPAGHGAVQAELEKAFRAVPTPQQARQDIWTLTQTPHIAGSPEDYKTAQYVLEQFRAAGLEAEIKEYQVLLPLPKEVKIDLLEPVSREGPTPEEDGAIDRAAQAARAMPAFNAYSPSGEVTAQVVYANYGLPEDYARLKQLGIEVAGKIVLVRYGKCFRGVKAYVAQENGAGGLLIYSDPADDGFRQGDVFPRGPWRPPTAVQRGSILYLTEYAGDPLTPGAAATPDARRLPMEQASTLPRIPTAPLSYHDAAPILENLSGPVAPRDWQGALPFTYHLGPGSSKVRIKLVMDFRLRPIWNVMACISGKSQPDSWVILGNHRDAWTYGAVDPISGTAPLLAVARGLGQLLQQGWRPERTIILASWDAEEYGLIGSTEWAEENAAALRVQAVAYLNIDVGVSGPHFGASAVPSLGRLIREVTQEVTDPASGRSVHAVWTETAQRQRRESGIPVVVLNNSLPAQPGDVRVGDLGSGSDYTAFLQHLGVPALDIGFGGPYGVYHAAHDDFQWMEKFGDPTFRYSVAAAQILGTLALRLANAPLLPFDYEDYGKAMQTYLQDLEEELKKGNAAGKLPLAKAKAAAKRFREVAGVLAAKQAEVNARGGVDGMRLGRVNQRLLEVERNLLLDDGLPNRPWFRHAFYAPGVYTGYSAVVLPGVREGIGRADWQVAATQLGLAQKAIERATRTLTHALEALRGK